MSKNILKNIIIDAEETVGGRLLLLDIRPYAGYKEGVKGDQEGLTFNCLSEKMDFEKVDIKIEGILKPPFDFRGTPVQVEFGGLQGKLWQDWSNKGAVRLSLTANEIWLKDSKRIRSGEQK